MFFFFQNGVEMKVSKRQRKRLTVSKAAPRTVATAHAMVSSSGGGGLFDSILEHMFGWSDFPIV